MNVGKGIHKKDNHFLNAFSYNLEVKHDDYFLIYNEGKIHSVKKKEKETFIFTR